MADRRAGLILLAMVLYWGVFFTVSGISSRWTICQGQPQTDEEKQRQKGELSNQLLSLDRRIGKLSNAGVTVSMTAGQTQRLKEQIRQLDQARRLACTVGVFYFSHRYAALSLSTAAGILALSSLALISPNQEPTALNLASKPEFASDSSFAEDSFQTIRGFIKPGSPEQQKPAR